MAAREAEIAKRGRGYLPHWEGGLRMYMVTFRLADSLPRAALERIEFERRDILRTAARQGRGPSPPELKRLARLFTEKLEAYLDSGVGNCFLADERIAEVVATALRKFDGARYNLLAWCVMPNHVHVVMEVLGHNTLARILHSWKSYSANQANAILGRNSKFWQREYFDHLLRTPLHVDRAIRYVVENPAKAGLQNWTWVWARSP
ncbi:MAG: transposase [Acidobacteria bacterium]|nr:transposase [Acidobacteriota bacterium]